MKEKVKVRGYMKPIDSFHTLTVWEDVVHRLLADQIPEAGQCEMRAGIADGAEGVAPIFVHMMMRRLKVVSTIKVVLDRPIHARLLDRDRPAQRAAEYDQIHRVGIHALGVSPKI